MDTGADGLAEFVAKINAKCTTHVGHSTGGGEVARHVGRHRTQRVAKAVPIGAVPALMLSDEHDIARLKRPLRH
jgi:non-heme chloroperoxidase